jgi:hypothetical protein
MGYRELDDFEKEQNENDDEDERDSAASVVAESRSHAITTEAEHKDQNEQKDKHYLFLRAAKIRQMKSVMQIFIVLSWCEIFCFRALSLPKIASKGFF